MRHKPAPPRDRPSVSRPIDYVKAFETKDWQWAQVYDLDRRTFLRGVLEACASQGWVVQTVYDGRGRPLVDDAGHAVTERRERRIQIFTRTRPQKTDRRRAA